MKRKFRLVIAYDGSPFYGWQNNEDGSTVQGELQAVLNQILQEQVELEGASRTDAGVHAEAQVAHFITSKDLKDLSKLELSINALLPQTIRVRTIDPAPLAFHATLNAIGKEYHYLVACGPILMPLDRFTHWHVPQKLDIEAMRSLLPRLTGTRNFQAFCNAKKNESYSSFVRTVDSIRIFPTETSTLRFEVIGNQFLYKMVRNLIGSLIDVGRGRLTVDALLDAMAKGDRTLTGITAPAHGLTLKRVLYAGQNSQEDRGLPSLPEDREEQSR